MKKLERVILIAVILGTEPRPIFGAIVGLRARGGIHQDQPRQSICTKKANVLEHIPTSGRPPDQYTPPDTEHIQKIVEGHGHAGDSYDLPLWSYSASRLVV
jgi:hypothetical protein